MTPKRALTRIILPGLGLWLILFACNAPSIPMPPPDIHFFSFQQEPGHPGYVRLSLAPNPAVPEGSIITVKNLSLSADDFVGGEAGPGGAFETQPFEAAEGDLIQFDFLFDDRDGGVLCMHMSTTATELQENELCE